ncbi:MAG: DUF4058 family protein [Planctomycetes bacterium]|nr:DUF4058 family protein [Planctomycetota bacterium]
MPSPFPGMDPFLESRSDFPSLHNAMITYMQEHLQGKLPERYYAKSGERIWVDVSRWIEPDIHIGQARGTKPSQSSVATLVKETPVRPIIVTIPHDEQTEPYLEIFKKHGDKTRLVCSIEILSLTNKTPGEKGQNLYRRKQRDILRRKVHLVEIDLLRAGRHTTAVALDWAKEDAGDFDYHVCVRRFNRFEEFEVYPILMRQALPTVAIPLLPADGDIAVDLQAIFQRAYDAGPYSRALDYRTDTIDPPLTKEQDTWLRGMLKKAGVNRSRAVNTSS